MSDLGFSVSGSAARLFEALGRPAGFRPDSRYSGADPACSANAETQAPADEHREEDDKHDPVAEAWTQGFAAGHEQAAKDAADRAHADDEAREGLMLAFARLDASLEEDFRQRLRETVEALCETAIAPLALDTDLLVKRIERAVAMLSRADDERLIRLHPEDITLISPRLPEEWQVQGDLSLERGSIRVETANGGIEDGPGTWRQAIAEALERC